MKKEVFLILLLFFMPFALAEEQAPGINEAPFVNEIQQGSEKIQSDYLMHAWADLLKNSTFIGPIVGVTDTFFTAISPITTVILGVEYRLSWAFIFAVFLWIVLTWTIYLPCKELFHSKKIGLLVAALISSIIGTTGVIKRSVDTMATIVTTPVLLVIAGLITLVIAVIMIRLGGGLKNIIQKEREKSQKEQLDQDRKTIRSQANVAKKEFDSYKS